MRKARESGNAEGAKMRKMRESGKAECDRIVGRWMNGRVMERQTDGRKEGRTEGRKDGRTDGRKDGRTDRQTEGRTDGQTERRNILRRCERLGLSLCAVPSLNGTVCLSIWKGRDHGKGLGKGYGGRGRKECGKTE